MSTADTNKDEDKVDERGFVYSKNPPTLFDRVKSFLGIAVPDRGWRIRRDVGAGRVWCGTVAVMGLEEAGSHKLVLGTCDDGTEFVFGTDKRPSLLIAGTTGSGKSNLCHLIIQELLDRNIHTQWRFIFIDPKCVEFNNYKQYTPLLMCPVVQHNVDEAIAALTNVLEEIKKRELAQANGEKMHEPSILIVIDEFSDLVYQCPRETEDLIVRIAEADPELRIRLIVATSRPSADVFTEKILDAIPARFAGHLNTVEDSVRVLGVPGAELLSNSGEMIFMAKDREIPIKFQADLMSEGKLTKALKKEAELASISE